MPGTHTETCRHNKLMKPTVLSSLTKAQASRARRWLSSRASDLQGLEEDTVMNVAYGLRRGISLEAGNSAG